MTSKGIKPQETRDLTWKTPSTREGKTSSVAQRTASFVPSGNNLRTTKEELQRIVHLVPRSGPSIPATDLRFAPSEVGLSLERQNLDHNSTDLCDYVTTTGVC
jgi:hypothetical protein